VGAGGFASVAPLAAARALGVPVLIHQQDVEPGLANRLLTPLATAITLSLPASLAHFPRRRSSLTGNPVRPAVLAGDARLARTRFGLEAEVPTVLVTGGGTGALALNRLVAAAVPDLVRFCQVIHLTGRGRAVPPDRDSPRYRSFELLTDDMPHALAVADLVVSRAGMGTLTELAALGKPALVVPMPRSHQLANAEAFERLGAIEVADQDTLDGAALAARVQRLLDDPGRLVALSTAVARSMPRDAGARIAGVALALLGQTGAA
jgi:UDP-N-acetylglucosamine--N-acetylmuramyl-(pentapeptide) pyrophosphoryl-undecaprenol N-acetylglucosamine transferase